VIRSTCERVHLEAITIRIALGKTRARVKTKTKTKTTPTKLKVATPRQNPSAVRTTVTGSEVVATRDLTGVVHVLSFLSLVIVGEKQIVGFIAIYA
jgi:hypothetical protein